MTTKLIYKWEFYSFLKYIFIYIHKNKSSTNVNFYVKTMLKLLVIHFGKNIAAVLKYWGVKCFSDIAKALNNLVKLGVVQCNAMHKLLLHFNSYSLNDFLKRFV